MTTQVALSDASAAMISATANKPLNGFEANNNCSSVAKEREAQFGDEIVLNLEEHQINWPGNH